MQLNLDIDIQQEQRVMWKEVMNKIILVNSVHCVKCF